MLDLCLAWSLCSFCLAAGGRGEREREIGSKVGGLGGGEREDVGGLLSW